MSQPAGSTTTRSRRARRAVRNAEYTGPDDIYREPGDGTRSPGAATPSTAIPAAARGGSTRATARSSARSKPRSSRQIEPGVPDMNPMGCQKGALLEPAALQRGARPLSDEARRRARRRQVGSASPGRPRCNDIADAILDASAGPGTAVALPHRHAGRGGTQQIQRLLGQLGFSGHRPASGDQRLQPRHLHDLREVRRRPGADDFFHSELVLIWHANPVYTNITWYHFMQEARYNGGEVVTIAPDFSPSAVHADYHLPIEIGTDAAFANAMSQVVIAEDLLDGTSCRSRPICRSWCASTAAASCAPTDLGAGADDQFYWLDAKTGTVVEAPRATLDPGRRRSRRSTGSARSTLAGGARRGATGVRAAARHAQRALHAGEGASDLRRPPRHDPQARPQDRGEADAHHDGLELRQVLPRRPDGARDDAHPRAHRQLGQARHRRAQLGRALDGMFTVLLKRKAGPEGAQEVVMASLTRCRTCIDDGDPTITDEMESTRLRALDQRRRWAMTPPAFFWYHHCGYREIWNRPGYNDPEMKRPSTSISTKRSRRAGGQAAGAGRSAAEPRFLIEVGGNLLRRTRGGAAHAARAPVAEAQDDRLGRLAHQHHRPYADYILPAAQHYEKMTFHSRCRT